MKRNTLLKSLLLTALLLLATYAFAGNTVTLSSPAMLNGKELPAGEYHVKISGSGPTADVTFLRGKTEVATAKATVKDTGSKSNGDSITIASNPDGSRSIAAIQLSGKTQRLVFESNEQASTSSDSGGSGKQ